MVEDTKDKETPDGEDEGEPGDTPNSEKQNHIRTEEEKRKAIWLGPWHYKKGQTGNPGGRPLGKSIKQRAKEMLAGLTEEEFQEFLNGLPKAEIWKMAEGNPDNKLEATVTPLGEMLKQIRGDNKEPLVNDKPNDIGNIGDAKVDGVEKVEIEPSLLHKIQDGREHLVPNESGPTSPTSGSPLPERHTES